MINILPSSPCVPDQSPLSTSLCDSFWAGGFPYLGTILLKIPPRKLWDSCGGLDGCCGGCCWVYCRSSHCCSLSLCSWVRGGRGATGAVGGPRPGSRRGISDTGHRRRLRTLTSRLRC
ncbi:hypothetical protein BO99DRAFT_64551 [Aspergillus violaceofuscus CBS 115571]|uniref:Uncharacterized protein n=1 Tax=Aspergillus violaceofuscus (strain CBS 115571) TaxID=1450538 RepID=A0A2V5GQM3_ASPV1|nr:hypothetical protein BO99DRAFT_64551 [Aspergillus violaceofuscus CBS 115571]